MWFVSGVRTVMGAVASMALLMVSRQTGDAEWTCEMGQGVTWYTKSYHGRHQPDAIGLRVDAVLAVPRTQTNHLVGPLQPIFITKPRAR
jgi:hypothetical protein